MIIPALASHLMLNSASERFSSSKLARAIRTKPTWRGARGAYEDLLLAYPNSAFTGQAKQRIATIGSRDLQASYNVAEFYRKKGETESAAYYYQEVIDGAAPSDLRNRAAAQLAALSN